MTWAEAARRQASCSAGGALHSIYAKGDYRDVHIEADSVIYCDIPYKGTHGYIDRHKGDGFDYDAFYDWCCAQTVPVYISEYDMPPAVYVLHI